MKRAVLILLAVFLLLPALHGCGNVKDGGGFSIVTTIFTV